MKITSRRCFSLWLRSDFDFTSYKKRVVSVRPMGTKRNNCFMHGSAILCVDGILKNFFLEYGLMHGRLMVEFITKM